MTNYNYVNMPGFGDPETYGFYVEDQGTYDTVEVFVDEPSFDSDSFVAIVETYNSEFSSVIEVITDNGVLPSTSLTEADVQMIKNCYIVQKFKEKSKGI